MVWDKQIHQQKTLKKVLDVGLRSRLSEQNRERNLHAANLDNFERCRYCNWGACIDVPKEADKVFHCQNPNCMAEICRLCGKDWDDDHIGKRCDEMVQNIQDKARKEFEEKMSEAVIRKCPNCKTPFDKVEGCNKMTCRCGHTMCYLCREPKINYNHFCPHPKEPNESACPSNCGRCMLWEVAAQRDAKVLDEIQNQAKNDERLAAAATIVNQSTQNDVRLPNRPPADRPVGPDHPPSPPPPINRVIPPAAPRPQMNRVVPPPPHHLHRPAVARMHGPPPPPAPGYLVRNLFNELLDVRRPHHQN